MATITKKVSKAVAGTHRYQYWASSENADDGTVIAAADVFMIENSLGKPAHYVYLETSAGITLTIRLNSQVTLYPLRDSRLNWPVPEKDLSDPRTHTDSSMAAITIGAGEVFELDGVLPVSDIQLVTFSGGTFELFVA